jgi:hypothetical protein
MKEEAGTRKSRVKYKDLREYLQLLESAGLLHRIKIHRVAAWESTQR